MLWSIVSAVAVTTTAVAEVSVYTDEASFTIAAKAVGALSFADDLNDGSKFGDVVTLTNLTITGVDGNIAAFPNTNETNAIDGTGYLRFRVSTTASVTFTFNTPILAFGFETNPHQTGLGQAFNINVGSTTSTYSMPSTDVTEFRGFVSDSPFITFTIYGLDSSLGKFNGIDNLVGYAAVPEPSTGSYAAVVGLLVVGFTVARRGRRHPQAG